MASIGPEASLSELRAALIDGDVRAVDLVETTLARIRERDEGIGAWLRTVDDEARAAAEDVDRRREAGEPLGALAGIPVGIKDLIATRGVETTAGSRILEGFRPPYDATVVQRLRDADAIPIGKLNLDEFAMGSSNENSAWGVVRNPWDTSRVPGGSSGGSAAALADGTAPLTLGTDTGGSIRQPASFCGIVGLKPTYGRVSRRGVVAFASSLDQVGPMGRSTRDVANLLGVLAGHDPGDATSLQAPCPDCIGRLNADVSGVRVGVPREYFGGGSEEEVEARVREALETLEGLGARPVEISLPHTRYAIPTYHIVATAEASSNLARYDGIRYGHRTAEAVGDVGQLYDRTRAEGFGDEVKRRILLGTYALSSGYYDAYYLKAQKVRTLIRRDFEQAFEACDVIAGPTSPVTAVQVGERVDDPLRMYAMDAFTVPASLAGLPCMSLPCGVDGRRLPVGLQLVGPPLREPDLLRVAHAYEQARGPFSIPFGDG